jgi:hypothetical protein
MGQGSALIYQDCCYSWDKREVIVVIARTQRRLSNLHLRERMKECHKLPDRQNQHQQLDLMMNTR